MNSDFGEGSSRTPLLLPEAYLGESNSDEREGNATSTGSRDRPAGLPRSFPGRSTSNSSIVVRGGDALNIEADRIDIEVAHWTEEETRRLISKYGEALIDVVNRNGTPLICDAIVQKHPESAILLLEHALARERLIDFETGECQTLEWAIENQAEVIARFVLDSVAQQKLPLKVSCCILTKYLVPLVKTFPDLMIDYIKSDRFLFEYGRFSVPRSLIDKNGKCPIAMMTRTLLDDRAMNDSEAAKDFWINHCDEHSNELQKLSNFKTIVAAKFFCLNLFPFSASERSHLSVCLDKQDYPAEVFESETLKTLVDWWFYYHRHLHYLFITVDGILTLIFTIFSLVYWHRYRIGTAYRPLLLGLLFTSLMFRYGSSLFYMSSTRFSILFIECVLFIQICITTRYYSHSAFLVSLGCVLQWISIFRLSQAFDRMGPFISMVSSAVKDSWHFLLLVAVMIFGYSVAFMAIFQSGSVKDDDGFFSSFLRIIETLFYSSIGNFEVKMFRSSSGFLRVWATLLFASFIYIGPIILISLLIAILTDTYDRVRAKEQAELRKLRLRIVASCQAFKRSSDKPHIKIVKETYRGLILRFLSFRGVSSPVVTSEPDHFYFHYLVPVEDSKFESRVGKWQGRLVAFERAIKAEAQKNAERSKRQHEVLENEIKGLKEKINGLKDSTHRLETSTSRLETAMGQILQKLERIGP